MSDNTTETPTGIKGIRSFKERFIRRGPQVAKVPEPAAVQERLLPANLFQLNEAGTQSARSVVLNSEAVDRGLPPQHLVDSNEAVVQFTGTMQEFAEFIAQAQKEPLREVDSESYRDPSVPTVLRRTGIEVIGSFQAPRDQYLDYPKGAAKAPVRKEVLGISSGDDWSRVVLILGREHAFPLPKPGDYADWSNVRREVDDLHLDNISASGVNYVNIAQEHPYLDGMSQLYIAGARDTGEVMFNTASSRFDGGFMTGYTDTQLHVQERKPSPGQKIKDSDMSFWTLKAGAQETSTSLNNIVVPARMTANLVPAPATTAAK